MIIESFTFARLPAMVPALSMVPLVDLKERVPLFPIVKVLSFATSRAWVILSFPLPVYFTLSLTIKVPIFELLAIPLFPKLAPLLIVIEEIEASVSFKIPWAIVPETSKVLMLPELAILPPMVPVFSTKLISLPLSFVTSPVIVPSLIKSEVLQIVLPLLLQSL